MDCERGRTDRDDRGNNVEEEDDAMMGDRRVAHGINFDDYSSSGTTRIYRLADPNNATFGGRTGSVAVKVVVSSDGHTVPSTDPQRTKSHLYNEYILSRRPNSLLSKCSSVRAALRLAGHGHVQEDGSGGGVGPHSHALYLEWADGVTLTDWIRRRSPSPSSRSAAPLVIAVRLAWHIAGAISEVHEAGVVLNNISSDNMIVDDFRRNCAPGEGVDDQRGWGEISREGGGNTGRTETDDFSVKVIDLASAEILRENDPAGSARAIGGDLLALGQVLFEIFFSGGRDSDDGPPESSMRHLDDERLLLDDNGMPRCITTLVAKLIGRGGQYGGHRYRSASEVQMDLSQILDYQEGFLAMRGSSDDNGSEASMSESGTLRFSHDRLYGRAAEMSVLLEATSRVIGTAEGPTGRSEVVLVSGISGSGKSSLVRTALMRQSLIRGGGGYYLLSGKFDSLRQVESLSAIIDALAEFCGQLIINEDSGASGGGSSPEAVRIKVSIMDEVGSDGASVLADLIPGLGRLLGVEPGTTAAKVGGKEGQNRLRHVLRLFVRAISKCSGPPLRRRRPLVLFLDDLQWADMASLDLVRALVADGEGCGPLLFIGCYRDNEVDHDHALAVQLREMMESKVVPVTTIRIGSIGGDAMNHLISDAMCELRSCTVPLTDAIQHKTNGNPFFAIEVSTTLLDEGLLEFSDAAGSWEWDAGGIRAKNVADTAFELVVKKILKLPADVRGALQVAACLGHHCEESTLCLIEDDGAGVTQTPDGNSCGLDCDCPNGRGYLAQMLDRAAKQGFLEKTGAKFEFVHDQIQHATYASIPEYERGMLHQRIGKRIWKRSPPENLEKVLFLAVDQLYLGSMFVGEADRDSLAWLYLRAGKKAMSSSLFLPAATYLKAGTVLLAPDCWDHQYDLSLQLYVSCAETYFYNGNFDAMGEMLDEIFANAQSFDDKLGAYGTLVNSLGSMDKVQDAIKTTFLVLEELEEHFPQSEDASHHVVSNWLSTRDMLEAYTDETLVTMQMMKDERKIAAMSFLKTLILYTYMAAQQYLPLVTFRMMQVTLRYGLCKESAFAFAMYGIISCGSFDDIDRGYQFGQLALQLLERFDGNDCVARVYVAIYGNINHWKEPLRLSLEPLLRGHQVGLMLGDIEYGMVNARLFCLLSFQCGTKLAPLEEEMRVFCDAMAQYNQMTILAFVAITRQTVQNLMGLSDDTLELTGEAMNQNQMLENAATKKNLLISCCIHYHRMWLAYYFGNYELAAHLAEKSRNVDKLCTGEFVVANHAFFDGLTALALSRKSNDSKSQDLAKQALTRMKNWAVHAPCNFAHKVALLEAESAFVSEAHSLAARKYDSAIALAGENGFVNEQALACERAALFYSEVGDKPRASVFYDRAHDLYLEWGARGKALHLRDQSLSFFMADNT